MIRSAVAISALFAASHATAHARHSHHSAHLRHVAWARPAGTARVIQCVAFAKQDAGIEIAGNARDWWDNAAGSYERGNRPEEGSVLSFEANGRMPLGHVAVVSGVQDSRTITIDQSHWNSRGITRDIEVKDVSEDNDWTAVRVQLGRREEFGSIYPTHGFIYPRPDRGTLVANVAHAPMPQLDEAPADLRTASYGRDRTVEVAEAPGTPLDLSIRGVEDPEPIHLLKRVSSWRRAGRRLRGR